jgi:hypothetical protein
MPPDGRFYLTLTGIEPSPYQSQILFINPPVFELLQKELKRRFCLGHNHHPTGVLIQAMHQSWTANFPNVFEFGAVVHQGVEQGSLAVAGARMDHQAWGLFTTRRS